MTSKNNLAPVASRPSGPKILVLLLAGVGILIALVLIGLGIYLWARTNQAAGVPTLAPTSTVTATPAAEQPTPLPGVVIVVPTRTATPTPLPAAQSSDSVSLLATVTRAPENTPTPPALRPQRTEQVAVDGIIELVAPDDNIQIGDTVEFKWRWLENKGCAEPPDGYAFEIRVWRDNNAAGPRGAMDAKAQKQNISCDSPTGIRSFTISGIKTVPGFEGSTEGRFRWDVALVQLEPYEPKISPPYRIFFTN
jgi:hypothetical protein